MGTELILRHPSVGELERDFEANLRKGRAWISGPPSLGEREYCTLCIEPPGGGEPLRVRAEAVWIDATHGGTGLSFVNFDAAGLEALRAFVARVSHAQASVDGARAAAPADVPDEPAEASVARAAAPADVPDESADSEIDASPAARNLHDRVRALEPGERDVMARHGSLPERVALERCYGGSVWEGLLHNPQITPREVLRMAKSTSLPGSLVNLLVANRAWVTDGAINQALLGNPRLSGAHLERVLRPLPQADLVRVAEQSSLRMQVRQAAKRLIRR